MYPDAALLLVRSLLVQAAPLTDILECVSILLLSSQKINERLLGSLLSLDVPRLTEFKGKTSHCEWSHFHIARVCFPTSMLLDRHCA